MHHSVQIPEIDGSPCVTVHRRFFDEGEPVGPGEVLLELDTGNGILPVVATGWGVVAWVDELDAVRRPGDFIAHIDFHIDQSGKQAGCRPRQSPALRWRLAMGLNRS